MKSFISLAAGVVALGLLAGAAQAAPAYLKIEGVKGEAGVAVATGDIKGGKAKPRAKSGDHKDEIPIESARKTAGAGARVQAPTGTSAALLVPAIQKARP